MQKEEEYRETAHGLFVDENGVTYCPNCGATLENMRHVNGCIVCMNCGYSPCS